ncbi:hotdog fold thioesterase [Azospirillum brasilense]|uniref:PaaI family thioesterase n=1 Tax=Azospirillum brasilense TaxID=192 RepID=UPI00190E0C7B|nr:PaaI family thioesterase [Azospirillum brasilense]MBK3737213.1 hotdog fold thioesterase [Azospirillum brasilense]
MDDLMQGEPASGFQTLLGYTLVRWEDGVAELGLTIAPQHRNRGGVLHGGALMTLLDTVMGFAATHCVVPGHSRRVVTLSLSSSFLGAVADGTVVARGTLLGGGRKIVGCRGEVRRKDDGALLASAEGMFKYSPGRENPEGTPR